MLRHFIRVLAVLSALLCSGMSTALADAPAELTTTITDRANALGDRTVQVQDAINKLENDQGVRLYVVYVNDFSGANATTWADDTAELSGLGRDDVLMAVAVEERRYGFSADTNFRLSDAQLAEVAKTSVVPALSKSDWAGAAIGAASGLNTALSAPAPTATGGSGTGFLIALLVLAGLGLLALLYFRRRKSTRSAATAKALEAKAGQALVQTDDAVKTSEQEIGFAAAQFGDEPTAPFVAALEFAKGELNQAFRLRQQLDDEIPEDAATRTAMLEEIVSRCEAANARLDAEAAAFDRLRDLETQAPQVLAEVEQAHGLLAPKVAEVRAVLADTAARYAPTALAPVQSNPDEAVSRLDFAVRNLDQAKAAIAASDNAKAVVPVLAAQSAVDQAQQLLEAVTRRADELDQAAAGLKPALEHVAANLAAAKATAADERFTADLSSQIAFAESAATQVANAIVAGPVDPIAQLRRVEEAQRALDEALSGVRGKQAREQEARGLLDQSLLAARSEIGAAKDFITTNRGAIGSTARTRLAEAERLLKQAAAQAQADPVAALAAAQRADALAEEATQAAHNDIAASGLVGNGRGGSGGTGATMGAVLGGILIESMLSGARQSGRPSRQSPQRSRMPSQAPGSFGGARTRGRRGAGGSF